MKKLLIGLVLSLLAVPGWSQTYFTIFGPAAGIQKNTGSTPFNTAATIGDFNTLLSTSPGLLLGGATGGAQGAGSINATALYVNGSPVGISGGAVSSVGLAMTNMPCTVSGSPVTAAGTLTCTANTESANTAWMGPTTGAAASPTFRALVSADVPAINLATSGNGGVTGTLGVTNGGEGIATATLGDIRYGSGTNTLATLAGNTTSTKKFFTQTGTGSVSASPSWATIAAGDIPSLGANPSATIGLTAVNGTATTYMTSDSAPPLSQAISPTWSGTHTFSNAITVNGGGSSLKGGVTITAPSGGTALTVTGTGSALVMQANAAGNSRAITVDSTSSGGPYIALTTSGSDLGFVGSAASTVSGSLSDFSIVNAGNHSLILGTNAASRLSVSGAGDVTINAPSSGDALTVTGPANSKAGTFHGASTTGQSFGVDVIAGTNSSDRGFGVFNQAGSTLYFAIDGDGGAVVGSPTGGDKGSGTLNAANLYVNGSAVLTSAGASTKLAGAVMTSSGGNTCTINQNNGGIASCSEGAAGNVNITFTTGYYATSAVCVVTGVNNDPPVATGQGTFSGAGNYNVLLRNISGTLTDGPFSIICFGS